MEKSIRALVHDTLEEMFDMLGKGEAMLNDNRVVLLCRNPAGKPLPRSIDGLRGPKTNLTPLKAP